jgi:hypothetical protein
MLLIPPIHDKQVENIIRQLSELRSQYSEAVLRDSFLSVKKEIRIKINQLQHTLNEVNPGQKIY